MLYHINFGPPILDPGAKVVAPVKAIVPRDPRAAEGISDLGQLSQRAGRLLASRSTSSSCWPTATARRKCCSRTRTARRASACATARSNCPTSRCGRTRRWRPTATSPAWSRARTFPIRVRSKAEQGRVVKLKPGETVKFEVELDVLGDAKAVATAEAGDRETARQRRTAGVLHAASRLDAESDAGLRSTLGSSAER